MKTYFATFALLAIGVLSGGPSVAAPAGSTGHRPATEILATPVVTYECRRDDSGWHYMRGERRVTCRLRRRFEQRFSAARMALD
jgi:hypothetical protein